MTEFTENTLLELEGLQHDHSYSQIWAQSLIKAKHELGQLESATWRKRQAHIADRRWIHALKLGIFMDDDMEEGGPAMDDAVLPGDVVIAIAEEELAPADRDETQEETETPAVKNVEDLFIVGTDEEEIDEVDDETSDPGELASSEEEPEEDRIATTTDVIQQIDRPENEEEEEVSPFVGWLKSLPAIAGYTDRAAEEKTTERVETVSDIDTDTDTDTRSGNEQVEKKKKKKKKKKKGKNKKGKDKKKKQKEQESAAMPFQDLVVNSMELGDDISSEPLARLLKEHGHFHLAEKIYRRLMEKYPEKSSYFAAQIEELNEEE